ncbi:MAG TPA: hypothetical protein VF733_06355 [Candidatus Saccharimonadales bacterium]
MPDVKQTLHQVSPPIDPPDDGDAASAPEVPHEIAKKYGLHDKVEAPKSDATEVRNEVIAPQAASNTDINSEDPRLEDPETDAAVDDIVNKEGDVLLAAQDGVSLQDRAAVKSPRKGGLPALGRFIARWWRNKPARWLTIGVLIGLLAAVAVIPRARYAVLNTAGVRSSASIMVVDSATELPLKHVTFRLGDKQARTDSNGVARLQDLKLGTYDLTISRIAFAPQKQTITIGWGSNPLGKFKLRAVGTQYTLIITDYVSGKPIAGAEADAQILSAKSDNNGKAILTVGDTDVTTLSLTITANGYRSEIAVLDAESSSQKQITLVPDRRVVYVSKTGGKQDVYSSDLDGKNAKLLLAATGKENGSSSLVVSPDNMQAAWVSTRDGARDADGYVLYSLTFINIERGTSNHVDRAQQIQLVDWLDKRLVYRSTIAGASAANPGRNRLVAYNYENNARTQLASANQFNAILSAGGYLYYAVSSDDAGAALGLFRIKPDGSSREQLVRQEVWTGIRTDYHTISVQTPEGWFALALDTKQLTRSESPVNTAGLQLVNNTRGQQTAWMGISGGKTVLFVQGTDGGEVKTLTTMTGMAYPIRWLSDSMITFRVVTGGESAEYVVSTLGGKPRKITDVAAVYGYAQIY